MNFTVANVEHFSKSFASLRYDPHAVRSYHLQAGSFMWSDEIPKFIDDGYPASLKIFVIYLLSYRTVLMRDQAVAEFEPLWNHLLKRCPNWPGFRAERRAPELGSVLDEIAEDAFSDLDRRMEIGRRWASRRSEHDTE